MPAGMTRRRRCGRTAQFCCLPKWRRGPTPLAITVSCLSSRIWLSQERVSLPEPPSPQKTMSKPPLLSMNGVTVISLGRIPVPKTKL